MLSPVFIGLINYKDREGKTEEHSFRRGIVSQGRQSSKASSTDLAGVARKEKESASGFREIEVFASGHCPFAVGRQTIFCKGSTSTNKRLFSFKDFNPQMSRFNFSLGHCHQLSAI